MPYIEVSTVRESAPFSSWLWFICAEGSFPAVLWGQLLGGTLRGAYVLYLRGPSSLVYSDHKNKIAVSASLSLGRVWF